MAAHTWSAVDDIDQITSLWDFSNPVETESKFQARLIKLRAKPEDDSQETTKQDLRAALLSQIAQTHSLRGKYKKARQLLDQAASLPGEKSPRVRVMVLLEQGRSYNSESNTQAALPYFQAAFATADAHHLDSLAIDAAHMIAIAETPQRAERWSLIALTIAETNDEAAAKSWLGSIYNNLGWTYFDDGQIDKALTLFEKGVAFHQTKGQTLQWQIARWNVARAHRELGQLDPAIKEQLELLKLADIGTPHFGYINEELGELDLLSTDKNHEPYFATAYSVLAEDDWLNNHEATRLARMNALGQGVRGQPTRSFTQ